MDTCKSARQSTDARFLLKVKEDMIMNKYEEEMLEYLHYYTQELEEAWADMEDEEDEEDEDE